MLLKGMQVQNEKIKSGLGCIIIRRKTSARLLPSWRRKEHSERAADAKSMIVQVHIRRRRRMICLKIESALHAVKRNINSFDEDLLPMSWWPSSSSLPIVVCHCYQIQFTSKYSIKMRCTCILLVLSPLDVIL